MNFADAMKKESTYTTTENGALALNTTSNACLDLFSTIGALREADDSRIQRLIADAYAENPLLATKIMFYGRDIREGAGERKTFRTLIKYMADMHPEALINNIDLIGVYGRYDDMYSLIGTGLEDAMWSAMKAQFEEDVESMKKGRAVSMLAKWIKTADASSKTTRELGILTAHKLGYDVYTFKRLVRALRKYIGVVETLMSSNRWEEIIYPTVPSRAMMIYRNAFMNHDGERFGEYINRAVRGEEKINSGTLYPYDLIERIINKNYWWRSDCKHAKANEVIEAQWRQLPDYVTKDTNAIVIADTSGSMDGHPICSAIGLAIYFAERNTGAYHNMWLSFSEKSQIQRISGETLEQKVNSMNMEGWSYNTNLKAAFQHILNIAKENHVLENEMPKALIIISDMEIDGCTEGNSRNWLFYDAMKREYEEAGYNIPNIVFWNVCSRHDVFHVDSKRRGVILCSGQSTTMFKNLISAIDKTPEEFMYEVINSKRYEHITIKSKEKE